MLWRNYLKKPRKETIEQLEILAVSGCDDMDCIDSVLYNANHLCPKLLSEETSRPNEIAQQILLDITVEEILNETN